MGSNCARSGCGLGVTALDVPPTVAKSVGLMSGRWRFKGPMSAPLKPRSVLDEEVGSSDCDVLQVTDFQALCLGALAVFPSQGMAGLVRSTLDAP